MNNYAEKEQDLKRHIQNCEDRIASSDLKLREYKFLIESLKGECDKMKSKVSSLEKTNEDLNTSFLKKDKELNCKQQELQYSKTEYEETITRHRGDHEGELRSIDAKVRKIMQAKDVTIEQLKQRLVQSENEHNAVTRAFYDLNENLK